jgi:phosphoglycolate phosphatase-like HAD superfamily hydrolase
MLLLAAQSLADLTDGGEYWMIGDRPEDEQAAKNAGINFIPAEVMLAKFSGSGMKEVEAKCDREILLKFLAI